MTLPVGMEYRIVDISSLELGAGATFRFRWALPGEAGSSDSDDALVRSVRTLGVLSPPFLAGTGDTLEVVSGFRRIAAAREAGLSAIPALIADTDQSLPVWLESSLHGAPLSEMERLILAAKASRLAGERLEGLLPFLSSIFGRKINAGLTARLAGLTAMSASVREAIHEGRVSPGDLLQLGSHPGIDLETAGGLLAGSGLSRSARRAAVRGMLGIADRGADAFSKFAGDYDPGMRLDEAIGGITHPGMTGDISFLHRTIEKIELPPGAAIHLPENLEGGSFTIEIKVRDGDDLRISLARLREASEDGVVEDMLEVLQGRS